MNLIAPVIPQDGDAVLVRQLGSHKRRYSRGRIDSTAKAAMHPRVEAVHGKDGEFIGNRITGDSGRPAFELYALADAFRVVFLGRTVRIRIRPAWERIWYRNPLYIEITPEPKDGDRVCPRIGDGQHWYIHLVLFDVDAGRALSFDHFHYVVVTRPSYGGKLPRMWIRWCYATQAFVPVQDPAKIRRLNRRLPR